MSLTCKALQVSVGLATPSPMQAEQFFMLTIVVDQSKVHFYRNIDYLGAADLPRPVTDCFNDGEGLLVGDAGMELSLLRSAALLCCSAHFLVLCHLIFHGPAPSSSLFSAAA